MWQIFTNKILHTLLGVFFKLISDKYKIYTPNSLSIKLKNENYLDVFLTLLNLCKMNEYASFLTKTCLKFEFW